MYLLCFSGQMLETWRKGRKRKKDSNSWQSNIYKSQQPERQRAVSLGSQGVQHGWDRPLQCRGQCHNQKATWVFVRTRGSCLGGFLPAFLSLVFKLSRVWRSCQTFFARFLCRRLTSFSFFFFFVRLFPMLSKQSMQNWNHSCAGKLNIYLIVQEGFFLLVSGMLSNWLNPFFI